jgi:ribosomal protein S12 methylthiotransferase accessory factor YcaO
MSRVSVIFCFREVPSLAISTPFALFELELEVTGLHEGVNEVVTFVRAQGADREERFLDVTNRVRLAVHCGAHSVVALIPLWRSSRCCRGSGLHVVPTRV